MTCEFFAKIIEIIRGEKKDFNLYFTYAVSGRPYPIDDATAIEVYLPKEGTPSVLTLALGTGVAVVGVGQLGHVLASLSEAQSLTLQKALGDEGLSFTAKVVRPSETRYFNFEKMLMVSDPLVKP